MFYVRQEANLRQTCALSIKHYNGISLLLLQIEQVYYLALVYITAVIPAQRPSS